MLHSVLSQLITKDVSLPALKLAWESQIDVQDITLPKISPSHYLQENLLTTDERRSLLCKQQRKVSYRNKGVDLFVEPAVIVLQNYKFGDNLTYPITIRNVGKISQKVTILMEENSVFKFDESSQRVCKFPPGMTMSVAIKFQPEDDHDYYHKLVVKTQTSRFPIPIIGLGGRGILNVADSILFEGVPVKYMKTKIIPVYNVGSKPAKFSLSTTGPFCVKPEKGMVVPKETFNLEISHFSSTKGVSDGHLMIKYENGEEIYVYLKGEVTEAEVGLSPQHLICNDTHIGLKTKALCTIVNNTDVICNFKWTTSPKPLNTDAFDDWGYLDGLQLGTSDLQGGSIWRKSLELTEQCRNRRQCEDFIMSMDDKLVSGDDDVDVFMHEFFVIHPVAGQVQPNSTMDIHVIFRPEKAGIINTFAYLDITGQEDRLPLQITGKGTGPRFRFGFDVLDVGTVFLGGNHSYEVPVLNIGEIQGKLEAHDNSATATSFIMTIEPKHVQLNPQEYGAFYVGFACTGKPGGFQEVVTFTVVGSDDIFYLTIRGEISFPKVRFAQKDLQFGYVSYGFPKTSQITLINDSLNSIEVLLKMDSDGEDPPVDYNKILESFRNDSFQFDNDPAEFVMEPHKIRLNPKGTQNVEVTICSHRIGPIKQQLLCFIIDKDGTMLQNVAYLNVSATSIVPSLTCENQEIILTKCYSQVPYPLEFLIRNNTEVSTCYCLVPQKNPKMKIDSEQMSGIVEAQSLTKIPVSVTVTGVGKGITGIYDFYAVGSDEKLFSITVKADALPALLKATPPQLDFGEVEVMNPTTASIEVLNPLPMEVHYTTTVVVTKSVGETWEVSVPEGVIEANQTVTLEVAVTLAENGAQNAVLQIKLLETSTTLDVPMTAKGTGTSLVFTPPLNFQDEINFGTLFANTEKTLEYEVKNVGFLPKILEWRNAKDPPPEQQAPPSGAGKGRFTAAKKPSPSAREKKSMNLPANFHTKRSSFKFTPLQTLLQPQSSMTLTITAGSSMSKAFEDNFVLWTSTPPSETPTTPSAKRLAAKQAKNKKKNSTLNPSIARHIKLKVLIESVALKFSTNHLVFRIDVSPTENSFQQRETVKIENTSKLPATVQFKTAFPFSIVAHTHEDPVEDFTYEFPPEDSYKLTLNFDGRHLRKDRGSVFFDSVLISSMVNVYGKEAVILRGEVYFPTLIFSETAINFGQIYNDTEAVQVFEVTNSSPYPLNYQWYIKPGSTEMEMDDDDDTEGYDDDDNEENEEELLEADGERDNVQEIEEQDFEVIQETEEIPPPPAPSLIESPSTGTPQKGTKSERKEKKSKKQKKQEAKSIAPSPPPPPAEEIPEEIGQEEGASPAMSNNPVNDAPKASEARLSVSNLPAMPNECRILDPSGIDFSPGAAKDMAGDNFTTYTSFLIDSAVLDDEARGSRNHNFRSKMLEIAGITDAPKENEDESTYLSCNRHEDVIGGSLQINEVIDIIPMKGTVNDGNSQTFTVVFYGQRNIKFKTTAICFVDGGTSKSITIEGSSVSNPNAVSVFTKPKTRRTKKTIPQDQEEEEDIDEEEEEAEGESESTARTILTSLESQEEEEEEME